MLAQGARSAARRFRDDSGSSLSRVLSLPQFAAGTTPDYAAYEALAVRAMAAGTTYIDPVSGRTVRKLTDASFASSLIGGSNLAVSTQYPSGPPAISLPWGTNMRTMYVVVRDGASNGHPVLFDFNESTGAVSNVRTAPNVARDLTFGFSHNPATPQIAYYIRSVGGDYRYIQRYDTVANADANTGNFPANLTAKLSDATYVNWLQWDQSDRWFTCMSGAAGVDVAVWDSLTGAAFGHAFANLDEPHITPDGAFVMVDRGMAGSDRIRTSDFAVLAPNSCGQVSHPVGVRPSKMALHQGTNMQLYNLAADASDTMQPAKEVSGYDVHKFNQWVQTNSDPLDDWIGIAGEDMSAGSYSSSSWAAATAPKYSVTVSSPAGLSGAIDEVVQENGSGTITQRLTKVASAAAIVAAGQYSYVGTTLTVRAFGDLDLTVAGNASRIRYFSKTALGYSGIGFYRAGGGTFARLLCHAYHTAGYTHEYDRNAFPSSSPDGQWVMWQSDMNLTTGRHDVFLARVY